jgi:hypothetical protein
MEGRVLTCVYCGHEYPQDTPSAGAQILTDHIRVCEKHPMRQAELTIKKLRSALIGLIGAETKEELEGMEAMTRTFIASDSVPKSDGIASINAIHAILETREGAAEIVEAGNSAPNTRMNKIAFHGGELTKMIREGLSDDETLALAMVLDAVVERNFIMREAVVCNTGATKS